MRLYTLNNSQCSPSCSFTVMSTGESKSVLSAIEYRCQLGLFCIYPLMQYVEKYCFIINAKLKQGRMRSLYRSPGYK